MKANHKKANTLYTHFLCPLWIDLSKLRTTAQSTSNSRKHTQNRFVSQEPSIVHTPYPTPYLLCCRRHHRTYFLLVSLFSLSDEMVFGFSIKIWTHIIVNLIEVFVSATRPPHISPLCCLKEYFAAGSSQPLYHSLIISIRSISDAYECRQVFDIIRNFVYLLGSVRVCRASTIFLIPVKGHKTIWLIEWQSMEHRVSNRKLVFGFCGFRACVSHLTAQPSWLWAEPTKRPTNIMYNDDSRLICIRNHSSKKVHGRLTKLTALCLCAPGFVPCHYTRERKWWISVCVCRFWGASLCMSNKDDDGRKIEPNYFRETEYLE